MIRTHTYETRTAHPTRPARRIDIEHTRQEHKRMQSLNYVIERQALDRHNERLQRALRTEQLRAAGIERPNGAALIVNRLRGAIGGMLIAAGESIRQEPARPAQIDPNPAKSVRVA